ncbi:MAG: hypothetical protein FWC03_02570 [Treponema sp.]|nr:hypothetical protein [Treponema sp.]
MDKWYSADTIEEKDVLLGQSTGRFDMIKLYNQSKIFNDIELLEFALKHGHKNQLYQLSVNYLIWKSRI